MILVWLVSSPTVLLANGHASRRLHRSFKSRSTIILIRQSKQICSATLHLLPHTFPLFLTGFSELCFTKHMRGSVGRECVVQTNKSFKWTNWMESLHKLIRSFLSSVELNHEHAGREWNCRHSLRELWGCDSRSRCDSSMIRKPTGHRELSLRTWFSFTYCADCGAVSLTHWVDSCSVTVLLKLVLCC